MNEAQMRFLLTAISNALIESDRNRISDLIQGGLVMLNDSSLEGHAAWANILMLELNKEKKGNHEK